MATTSMAAQTRAALASEWTKLVTIRSTYVSMFSALVIAVAGGAFGASGAAHDWPTMNAARRAGFDPVNISYDGLAFAQLAFAVLGVLMVSSEYATGLIATTFTATPQRKLVLATKTIIVGTAALTLGELFSFATFFAGQLPLRTQHLDVTLTGPHVLRAVAGAGIYLFTLTLIGLGVGVIIRHTAGAITAMFALVFIIPILASSLVGLTALPAKWNLWAAGNSLVSTLPPTVDQPSTGLATLICGTYLLATLGTAFLLVDRRDA